MDLLDAAVAPARHRSAPELLSELHRCIQIGLLCVQQSPGDRPAMSAVLSMLTSKDSVLEQPKSWHSAEEANGAMLLEPSTEVNLA